MGLTTQAQAEALKIILSSDKTNARQFEEKNGQVIGMDFVSQKKVVTKLNDKDEAEVLQATKLATGNYAVKVKVTAVKNPKTTAKVGDEYWVYFNKDKKQRRMDLYNANKEKVEDPIEALYAKMTGKVTARPAVATKKASAESVVQQIAKANETVKADSFCYNCQAQAGKLGIEFTRLFKVSPSPNVKQVETLVCWHDDRTTGARNPGVCKDGIEISEHLLSFVNDNFKQCVNEGLKSIGIQQPADKVNIHQISNFRPGSKVFLKKEKRYVYSTHSVGRALDIQTLSLQVNGETKTYTYGTERNSTSNRFFEGLRVCWDRKNRERLDCPKLPASSGRASIGCEDPDGNHNNHVHLALPYCTDNYGFAGI